MKMIIITIIMKMKMYIQDENNINMNFFNFYIALFDNNKRTFND